MWPNMEMDLAMSKLDAIRDVVRIAYGSDGDVRGRLFAAARDMLGEFAALLKEQAPAAGEEDD